MTENLEEFLKELTELSNKYKIYIGGCGCCGSPHLNSGDEAEGEYTVDENQDDLCWTYTLKVVTEKRLPVNSAVFSIEAN